MNTILVMKALEELIDNVVIDAVMDDDHCIEYVDFTVCLAIAALDMRKRRSELEPTYTHAMLEGDWCP